MESNNELNNLWFKICLYIFSVSLGIGAKLATIYKKRMITKKDVIISAMLAYSAAWVVLAILHAYNAPMWVMLGAAVVVGRDGDSILYALASLAKKYLSKYLIELGETIQNKHNETEKNSEDEHMRPV